MLNNETLVFWIGGWAHCPDYAEATTGGVLYKKANLKNLAILAGNTCVGAFRSATLLKKDSNTGVFLWILEIFKDTYFEGHLWTAASNYGNLAVFRENLLHWVEEINYSQQGKLAILKRTIY